MIFLSFRYADIPDEWEPPTPLPYKDHVSRYIRAHSAECIGSS